MLGRVGTAAAYAKLVEALTADPRVRLLYAFGSTVHGTRGPLGDLDVAVLLARRPSFEEEIDLRARVAQVEPEADLLVLNEAPPALRFEVITGGICLFARDEREQAEFEITSLSRFLDLQPVRDVQREYLRARVEARRGAAD